MRYDVVGVGIASPFRKTATHLLRPVPQSSGVITVPAGVTLTVDGGGVARVLAEAARLGDVTLQIVRDWVLRFNEGGPDGLFTRKAPGRARGRRRRCSAARRRAG